MLHKSLKQERRLPYCFPRSSIKFQGHTGQNITHFYQNWAFPDYRPVTAFKSLRFALFKVIRLISRSHSSRNRPILTQIGCFRTVTPVWIHQWLRNVAQSLKQHRRGALLFLAATKQLYKWYFPSVSLFVRLSVLSVCLSHLFDYVPIIVSSWTFQELLPMTKVRSMQKFKVRGQRSRSQRSQPKLTVSGL